MIYSAPAPGRLRVFTLRRQILLISILALHASSFQGLVYSQQAANATLSGTVSDPQGAVVAGVSVIATQKTTGIRRETTTNDQGLYVLSNLAPGEYELRIEAKGFITKLSKTPVIVQVGQAVTLNVPLEIGISESTTIDLESYRALIDNTASKVDGVVESREVESLPLNGRNFLELALLIPGNAP